MYHCTASCIWESCFARQAITGSARFCWYRSVSRCCCRWRTIILSDNEAPWLIPTTPQWLFVWGPNQVLAGLYRTGVRRRARLSASGDAVPARTVKSVDWSRIHRLTELDSCSNWEMAPEARSTRPDVVGRQRRPTADAQRIFVIMSTSGHCFYDHPLTIRNVC